MTSDQMVFLCLISAKKGTKATSIWPPPEAPTRPDTTLLPANLRPPRPDLPGRPRDAPEQPAADADKPGVF